jgi:hypothetical protein
MKVVLSRLDLRLYLRFPRLESTAPSGARTLARGRGSLTLALGITAATIGLGALNRLVCLLFLASFADSRAVGTRGEEIVSLCVAGECQIFVLDLVVDCPDLTAATGSKETVSH